MKKISIIIAVYNIEKYIARCLDSVIKQNGDDIEIIIVDDGSTDNSLNICKSYQKKDKRIKIIHQNNKGLCAVRNIGFANSTGEYIWHIDGDDYIEDNSIAVLREYFDKYDIICFNFYRYLNNKKTMMKDIKKYDNKYDKYILSFVSAWNKVFKRFVLEGELFPESNTYNEIYLIPTLVKKSSNIIFLDKYLYFYIKRYDSLSNSRKFNLHDYLICLDNVYNKLKDNYFDATEAYYVNTLLIYNLVKEINGKEKLNYKKLNKIAKEKFPKYYQNRYYNKNIFMKVYIRLMYYDMIVLVKLITFLKFKIINRIKRK